MEARPEERFQGKNRMGPFPSSLSQGSSYTIERDGLPSTFLPSAPLGLYHLPSLTPFPLPPSIAFLPRARRGRGVAEVQIERSGERAPASASSSSIAGRTALAHELDRLMEPGQGWCIVLLVFSSLLPCFAQSSNTSIESLNSAIRDYAFKELVRRRTGVLYEVPLPRNLSGIRASVLRIRSGSLWSKGANFSSIYIPPRAMPTPSVRRLVIVYYDLGNRSSSYYNVPGYSLVSPVVGCLAYDASNVSSDTMKELELVLLGDRISVAFPEVELPKGMNSSIKCARFGRDGSMHLDDMVSENVCSAESTGHLTIVVPLVAPGSPPSMEQRAESRWKVWMTACACGVVGLVLVGLAGLGIFRLVRNKKMEDMESQAEDGETLGTIWVGRSKMPSATMTRTQPVIEDGSAPQRTSSLSLQF